MTNLSLAAQAVLDAFFFNWHDEPLSQDRQCLAAALRAAADQLAYTESEGRQFVYVPEILAIADELEGITYGTYRCNLEAQ